MAPYLALVREDAPQRNHELREVFNGLHWVVRTGSPCHICHTRFTTVGDALPAEPEMAFCSCLRSDGPRLLRALLRLAEGRASEPTVHPRQPHAPLHSRERGASWLRRSQARERLEVHAAVDALGHLLALLVGPADEQGEQIGEPAQAVQEATRGSVELAYVDRGYAGERPTAEAEARSIRLEVVKGHSQRPSTVLWSSRNLPLKLAGERTYPPQIVRVSSPTSSHTYSKATRPKGTGPSLLKKYGFSSSLDSSYPRCTRHP